MKRSELPLETRTLLTLGAKILAERILVSGVSPEEAIEQLDSQIEKHEHKFDVQTCKGTQEEVEAQAIEHSSRDYVAAVGIKEDGTAEAVFVRLTPNEVVNDDQAIRQKGRVHSATTYSDSFSVYRAEPISGADSLILVLASSVERAEELIERQTSIDPDHLDIRIDPDYQGLSGDERILEIVGFRQ